MAPAVAPIDLDTLDERPATAKTVAEDETRKTIERGYVAYPKRLYHQTRTNRKTGESVSTVVLDAVAHRALGSAWKETPPPRPRAVEEDDELDMPAEDAPVGPVAAAAAVVQPRRRRRPPANKGGV